MQLLKRNQQTISYKTYLGQTTETIDSEGYYTGERAVSYSELKTTRAYITAERGETSEQMFGKNLDYDRVMYLPMSSEIDEFSILWIETATTEANDYIVRRVATSLNHKVVAIKKVR